MIKFLSVPTIKCFPLISVAPPEPSNGLLPIVRKCTCRVEFYFFNAGMSNIWVYVLSKQIQPPCIIIGQLRSHYVYILQTIGAWILLSEMPHTSELLVASFFLFQCWTTSEYKGPTPSLLWSMHTIAHIKMCKNTLLKPIQVAAFAQNNEYIHSSKK